MALQIDTADPTGEERLVGADELFFSSTDRRGIILAGNPTFTRISGYPLEELVGSAHNIIRHPDMPGAVFKVMWDRLLSNRPMAGYVLNRAKGGDYYWVFATVVPVGGTLLSVRIAPMCGPLLGPVQRLYRQLRARELAACKGGLSMAEAAALGERELDRGVSLLGFESYEQFMIEALPAEIAARAGLATFRFRPRGQGPVADILTATAALDRMLGALVAKLADYRQLSSALTSASRSLLGAAEELDQAARAARTGSAALSGTVKVIHNVAEAMAVPCQQTVESVRRVVTELDSLRGLLAGLRFRIALARLHLDMVAAFAGELLDSVAPAGSAAQVPLLCDALQDGGEHLSATMTIVNDKLAAVSRAVRQAGESFNDARRFIGKWRLMVHKHRLGGMLAASVEPIDRMLSDGHEQFVQLTTLSGQCQAAIYPFDSAELDSQLLQIRRAVAAL